jgi:uncharacterized MAPEG superfamily protein
MTSSFTLAYGCILVMALLPMICAGIAKFGRTGSSSREGSYDNRDPRTWLGRLSGWRARANNAQANTFEALPFFFAAVIVAHQLQMPQARLDLLAVIFVGLRIAYVLAYIADKANARSLLWVLALSVNIAIFLMGFR